MKKIAFIALIPLLLAGCTSSLLSDNELRAMKPACAGGDAATCADIGHRVRAGQPQVSYAQAPI